MIKWCVSLRLAFNAILLISIADIASLVNADDDSKALYICSASDPAFLGKYVAGSGIADGVSTYVNHNEMSFFRNNGFWYLGNLAPWPRATHYRCVQTVGCNSHEDFPPSTADGVWTINTDFGKEPLPFISLTPCADKDEL